MKKVHNINKFDDELKGNEKPAQILMRSNVAGKSRKKREKCKTSKSVSTFLRNDVFDELFNAFEDESADFQRDSRIRNIVFETSDKTTFLGKSKKPREKRKTKDIRPKSIINWNVVDSLVKDDEADVVEVDETCKKKNVHSSKKRSFVGKSKSRRKKFKASDIDKKITITEDSAEKLLENDVTNAIDVNQVCETDSAVASRYVKKWKKRREEIENTSEIIKPIEDIDELFDVFEENRVDDVQLYLNIKDNDANNSEFASGCNKKLEETFGRFDIKNDAKNQINVGSSSNKKNALKSDSDPVWKSGVDALLKKYKTQEKGSVFTIETAETCVHEVAVPSGVEYIPLVKPNGNPAKEYPFVLDPFQKEAILCIENDQSVLISAHTSAGKTVAAEYSIAMALRENQRVIYTTPIKALSNQKYREFSDEFKDVGLVTGDVTINYEASCLIMTTEILRNMLYRGSQIMREVKWVIFDEIHYMRDKERGVVWEETLILLPDNVRFVFLSATIPNARQFAEWIAFIHHQPCHVVYTEYRPVPLQHYLFPAGGTGIHLIVDEHRNFREDNFNTAMSVLTDNNNVKVEFRDKRKQKLEAQSANCFNIIKMLMERKMTPIITFSFSKKECELYAVQLAKLDFSTREEKKLIDEILSNALNILGEEDRKLPQVESIRPILMRGIGVHHGGLLPILKETVEILFGENLLKVLFATETFAMGLNMPARTVLFTSCRKFDGKLNRFVTSGEYIQMSGRAGRRGLDDKGMVLMMIDEKVSPDVVKCVVQGQADPLNSAFHLTYNMILNLTRVDDINPEYMLERSFAQFQNQDTIPNICNKLKKLKKDYDGIRIENEDQVALYHTLQSKMDLLKEKIRQYVIMPVFLINFLQAGRMIKIFDEEREYDWGIITNNKKGDSKWKNYADCKASGSITFDVMVPSEKEENKDAHIMNCLTVKNSQILALSKIKINCPRDIRSSDNQKSISKSLEQVKKRLDEIPLVDPVCDMNISDKNLKKTVSDLNELERTLRGISVYKAPNIEELAKNYAKKFEISQEIENILTEFKQCHKIDQFMELKRHKKVLRKLNYCSSTDVVETKGKIACELSSGEELLMTELIFNGVFADLSAAQCVALLSCFVCDDKSNTPVPVQAAEQLSIPLRRMQELARLIVRISKECRIEIDEDAYIDRFKPHLMDVCFAWCHGSSFSEVCKKTDIFEGSIIRSFRRLEEALRQLAQATRNIGNDDLELKFNEAIVSLKRGIPFAASLYL